jgi:hypothetical protein
VCCRISYIENELKEDGQKHEYQKHIINSKGHKEWVGEYYYEPYMIEKK